MTSPGTAELGPYPGAGFMGERLVVYFFIMGTCLKEKREALPLWPPAAGGPMGDGCREDWAAVRGLSQRSKVSKTRGHFSTVSASAGCFSSDQRLNHISQRSLSLIDPQSEQPDLFETLRNFILVKYFKSETFFYQKTNKCINVEVHRSC